MDRYIYMHMDRYIYIHMDRYIYLHMDRYIYTHMDREANNLVILTAETAETATHLKLG